MRTPVDQIGQPEVRLAIVPISFSEAALFVKRVHRHHPSPTGHKFSIATADEAGVVRGVAIIGRPVARGNDNGWTLEVSRVATDGAKNACSILYGAAWRAAKALGYQKLITYTLTSEPGTSLRAAGWKVIGEVTARSWSCKSRPRIDKTPLQGKLKWEAA